MVERNLSQRIGVPKENGCAKSAPPKSLEVSRCTVGGKYSAVKSFRSFAEGKECRELADEKTAAEEAFALSKLGSNPSFADTAEDMLNKGRRLYGSHFTPTGRQLHDVRADIHPGLIHPGQWALKRLQDVLDRWGPVSR